eukprot:TRINITY_DN95134_c0_g1_i1.p1 TRINITY_DN95134_c0_g1~~TRINITY_DN95134_c0_g1_i1.p1  ORF type:complete len:374 (-),score=74.21 TRINITY_DN95134_c0_g1_i1:52-1146(-)
MAGSAHGPIEAALAAQRTFMDRYGDQLENLLNIGVYLVPVQDEEDELGGGFWSQAVYSAIDLFNLYRTVLLRTPEELPVCEPLGISSAQPSGQVSGQLRHLRLTYTLSAFVLRGLRSIQVLIEMDAWRRKGPEHALRICMRLEVVKLVLKMMLRARMPFSFYIDEDAIEAAEPPKLLEQKRSAVFGSTAADTGEARTAFVGRRTGRSLGALEARAGAAPRLLPLRTAVGLRSSCTAACTQLAVAEALYHSRPLLHLVLLRRRGRKSWAAWLLAFLLERISLNLLQLHVRPKDDTRAAALETAEVQRRRNMLWWSLARSPAFEEIGLRPCEVLDSILKRIPIINMFNIMELFLALQPYFFSTSGS